METPSRIFAPAPIHAPSPISTPFDDRDCSITGTEGSAEVLLPAEDVRIRRHEHVGADANAAGRKHFAVESDVGPGCQLDVAVLARQDRIAADEDAVADVDTAVGVPLGVEEAVVVDG